MIEALLAAVILIVGALYLRERRRVTTLAATLVRLTRDTTMRLAAADTALRASETIIERLPDPLILLDADHAVLRSNPAARSALGTDMAAMLRHPGLRTAIAGNKPVTVALELTVPIQREVQAAIIPLDPPLAGGVHTMVVLSDRSRERAIERMRADFVANASHELRTPLASLIGFIDTLLGPAADDKPAQRRFLAIMATQAARMHRLIDDLLSLSRIELNEHQPPTDRVDLAALIRGVTAGFEPRLPGRLAVTLDDALPLLTADADQITQVLNNLIENAAKYGADGAPIRLAATRASGGRFPARPGIALSVSDEGPGIPRAHLPRLTERFYRIDRGRSRAAGGTGLGLAIVKHIANRHRGQLTIDSEEGVGSTVTLWLPATTR